jgi:hypothetical protein
MPDRWTVERAVKASVLTPSSRLIMLVLLTTADPKTAIVPLRHTPSLTILCRDTGLDRATIQRHLNRLERAGWLRRCRPPLAESRRLHTRTGYHCQTPGLGAEDTLPRCIVHLGLGAPGTPGLGAPCTSNQIDSQTDIRSGDVLTARVIELVREATGKTISGRDAVRGIQTKLDGRRPRDPVAYLARVIATDPRWWLPTQIPPAYKAPAGKVDP